jgi:hypothetical protein
MSRDNALVDLLDQLLAGGVVLHGDLTLAVADIDLVQVSLRALLASVETAQPDVADGVELIVRVDDAAESTGTDRLLRGAALERAHPVLSELAASSVRVRRGYAYRVDEADVDAFRERVTALDPDLVVSAP